jgi:SMI1-KNR4 cell-wall
MAIEDLVATIPPPMVPIDARGDWSIAECEFGVRFPNDFRELIHRYGTGRFFGGLFIINPLTPWGRKMIAADLDRYRELCEACEISLVLHPNRPGLFPWGGDSNGHLYCWWTEGEPDSWPIVQVAHGEEETPHRADVPITSFLVNYGKNMYTAMMGGRVFDRTDNIFKAGIPWSK